MTTTRVFKAGNSQAVRIPSEFAFSSDIKEVQIERQGDKIIMKPVRVSMGNLVAILRASAGRAPRRERPEIDVPDRRQTRAVSENA
jgi:antitoxin VapB